MGAMANKILSGIMGLVVGDALGVPVEFQSRESLKRNPVKEMRAYGTYNARFILCHATGSFSWPKNSLSKPTAVR